jgi:PKD repeat protein
MFIGALVFIPFSVSADNFVGGIPLETVKSGTVSGGLYVDAGNTWWAASPGSQDVQKTFAVIQNVSDIQWARLYVAVYCGHMQNNYKGNVAVTFDGNGNGTYETSLGTEYLNVPFVYITNGGNDNSAFPNHGTGEPFKLVNTHTNRVTSDYLMWYDVTSLITSASPQAHVVTTAIDGSFDGRIKLITLVVAYNDGDDDTIYYWVNQGHDTDTYYAGDDYTGFTEFDLSGITGTAQSATLTVNHIASEDGFYSWIGDSLPTDPSPATHPPGSNNQGAYFGYNIWDVTSLVSPGDFNDLTYDRTGEFYKIPLAVLTVQKRVPALPPGANFSATPRSGETPAEIRFTDLSTNNPDAWKWEYRYMPDGGTSYGTYTQFATTRNPVFTFADVGTYTIRLTASNDVGSGSEIKTGYITITPAAPPVAAFTATPASGTAPLTVSFTDQSSGTVTSRAWDFDDDGTIDSTAKNPSHTYTTPGSYAVNLTVTGPGGTDSERKTGYITVTSASPVAAFTATPRSGSPPLTVTFTDHSAGTVTTWAWDFTSDGTIDSTTKNTTYTYGKTGTYTVNLTVTGPGGSSSTTDTITVSQTALLPDANFTADVTRGNVPLTVRFKDKSERTVSSWEWDFNNDGIIDSREQDPVYIYPEAGIFTVKLTVRGPGGSDTEIKTDYITVRGTPDCDLTIAGDIKPVNLGFTVFAKESNTLRIFTVKNNGPAPSPATTIELKASDGFTGRVPVPSLASGENTTLQIIDTTIRSGAGQSIRYTVTVDPDDAVAETDETNNVRVSASKVVTYNGYKGKRYWDGSDITTRKTFDIHGGLIHSFGDSTYRSGSAGGGGWTTYTVTWSPDDLPVPSNATVKSAILYVPYTWDNTNAAESISISLNGESKTRGKVFTDRSNFGAYADYDYGLQIYDVTSSFQKNAWNTATFSRSSSDAKLSMYGCTLAVVYEDADSSRKQIFINEGFDLLGADEDGYATTPEEATAYVPFSGLTLDPAKVSSADLITFVASGDSEGTLLFNDASLGSSVWDYGASAGPQVAVTSRDVSNSLAKTGNFARIQSTPGETPAMAAMQQFLVVEYGILTVDKTSAAALVANFTAEPLNGTAPLAVNFTDHSTGNPVSWAWDFENDRIIDNTTQNPQYTYQNSGNYSVLLTVKNATTTVTLTRNGYILVTNATILSNVTALPMDTIAASTSAPDLKASSSYQDTATLSDTGPVVTSAVTPIQESGDVFKVIIGALQSGVDQIIKGFSTMWSHLPFVGGGGQGT